MARTSTAITCGCPAPIPLKHRATGEAIGYRDSRSQARCVQLLAWDAFPNRLNRPVLIDAGLATDYKVLINARRLALSCLFKSAN
jgi:hypothetical protein